MMVHWMIVVRMVFTGVSTASDTENSSALAFVQKWYWYRK
jgi:hypothetical protein